MHERIEVAKYPDKESRSDGQREPVRDVWTTSW